MKPLFTALTAAFFALLSSNANATPVLELKIIQPADIGISISFFVSGTNLWPAAIPSGGIAAGGTGVIDQFVDLPDPDLSNVYFAGYGVFTQGGSSTPDVFVAEPASGHVSDLLAWAIGPPWISLAALTPESGLSGDLWIVNGPAYHDSWLVGRWELSEVPEPATCVLLGTGLAVAGIRRRFRALRG